MRRAEVAPAPPAPPISAGPPERRCGGPGCWRLELGGIRLEEPWLYAWPSACTRCCLTPPTAIEPRVGVTRPCGAIAAGAIAGCCPLKRRTRCCACTANDDAAGRCPPRPTTCGSRPLGRWPTDGGRELVREPGPEPGPRWAARRLCPRASFDCRRCCCLSPCSAATGGRPCALPGLERWLFGFERPPDRGVGPMEPAELP